MRRINGQVVAFCVEVAVERYAEREALCSLSATFVDRRSEPRYLCPHLPLVQLSVSPTCGSILAAVHDISKQGIGLLCKDVIDPGTTLLLHLQPHWRAACAQVVHVTPVRGGALHIGCKLAEPLEDDELQAHLLPALDF
jgi:hypothetical protein